MTEVSTRPHAGATKAPPVKDAAAQSAPAPDWPKAAAPSPAPVSPSLIVLALRPNGTKFNGNRVERAEEAGFKRLNGRPPNPMGCVCPDTGQEIARFVLDREAELLGTLKEMQLHVDPEGCATWHQGGTMLMKMLEKYCILINASLCDGMGRALKDAERQAIADHIDAVIVQRRDADRAARIVNMPSGERRELSELSFMFSVLREAGERKKSYRSVYFDAPPMHYHEGRAKGMEMAGEIVAFYLRHKAEGLRLDFILREALQGSGNWFGNYLQADVNNVTAGFMDVVSTLIEVGARSLNPRWLPHCIEREKARHELWLKDREADRAKVVEQLRRGREAAKARRAAAGKEGGGS